MSRNLGWRVVGRIGMVGYDGRGFRSASRSRVSGAPWPGNGGRDSVDSELGVTRKDVCAPTY